MIDITCELIHKNAKLPTRSHDTDAGWDLYATEDVNINNGEVKIVGTGIKVNIPAGHVLILKGRSGLAAQGIDPLEFLEPEKNKILGGVIDSGYLGEIGLIIKNLGGQIKQIKKGDKICQVICLQLPECRFVSKSIEVKSARGEKGFGSSDSMNKEPAPLSPASLIPFDPMPKKSK